VSAISTGIVVLVVLVVLVVATVAVVILATVVTVDTVDTVVIVVIQVVQGTQDALRIKRLDCLHVDVKVVNEVLHHTNYLAVEVQQVFLMILRNLGIVHGLVQGVLEVGHSVDSAHRIGLLKVGVLHRNNAAHVLEFRFRPSL